jgi:hypothetical protein
MNRFWTIAIIMLLAVSSANAQVSWTIPAGDSSAPEVDFGTTGGVTLVAGATSTVPLRIPDGVQYATLQIRSGTTTYYTDSIYSVSGAIANASFTVGLYPNWNEANDDSGLTTGAPVNVYSIQSSGNAAAVAWYAMPSITNYGIYQIPVGSARWLVLSSHVVSDGLTAANANGFYAKVRFIRE